MEYLSHPEPLQKHHHPQLHQLTRFHQIALIISHIVVFIYTYGASLQDSAAGSLHLCLNRCVLSWESRRTAPKQQPNLEGTTSTIKEIHLRKAVRDWGEHHHYETAACIWKHVSDGARSRHPLKSLAQQFHGRAMEVHFGPNLRCSAQENS